jgi:hypothetical protein
MTGLSYAKFLEECVSKMNDPENSGQLSIPSEYESVAMYVAQKMIRKSATQYRDKMNFYIRDKKGMPLNWEHFVEAHALAFKDTHMLLLKSLIGTAEQIKTFEAEFFGKVDEIKRRFQNKNSKLLYEANEEIAKRCWHQATSGLTADNRFVCTL